MYWLINKRQDLIWIIGSSVPSFIVVLLYFSMTSVMGISITMTLVTLTLIWLLLFDGTHVFATYTRTYFDKEFRRQFGSFLWFSLLIVVVGPILMLFTYLFEGIETTRAVAVVFFRFGMIYAYFHLVRQHWGFISYYRSKNGENSPRTKRFDALLLSFGTIFPFLFYILSNDQPFSYAERFTISAEGWQLLFYYLLGLTAVTFLIMMAFTVTNLITSAGKSTLIKCMLIILCTAGSVQLILTFGLDAVLRTMMWTALAGFCVSIVFSVHDVMINRHQHKFNWPKSMLFIAVLMTHNVILLMDLPMVIPFIALTIFHNLQYLRFVHFHNANKYTGDGKKKYGFAVSVTEKFILFAALAFLFDMFVVLPSALSREMITHEMINYTFGTMFLGVAFHHYILDSVIWKRKKNKNLSKILHLDKNEVSV